MAKQKSTAAAMHAGCAADTGLREEVMETLLQLHIGFCALGRIQEAGPLLHQLMELAYHAPLIQRAPRKRRRPGLN